jgi:hypothetical protein
VVYTRAIRSTLFGALRKRIVASEKGNGDTIQPSLRLGARLAWVALTLLSLLFFIGGVPYRFAQLSQVCVQAPCTLNALSGDEAQALLALGFSLRTYAGWHIGLESMLGGAMTLLALFLVWRAFDTRQGVLVAFMLMLIGLNFMAEVDTAFVEHNPSFRFSYDLLTSLTGVSLILFLYVFPDGRFAPPLARFPFVLFGVVAMLEPFLRLGGETPSAQFSYLYLFTFLLSLVLGLAFQVYRYRFVSTPVQRQQTKWVLVGVGAIIGPILVYSMLVEIFPLEAGLPRLLFNTVGYGLLAFLILLFPISMVISILRYRLWDVDLIIRRTLVYAALTATLALVYFGAVVLLQSLIHGLTGQDSALAIVLSTLAIAALFAPLRSRIQQFFDRRFYRRNYDAAQSLAHFANTARDEVDLDVLTGELTGVVRETMQPEHVSLWLRRG